MNGRTGGWVYEYPGGASTYSLRYKFHGQTKYAPIGASDVVTLADARKKARMLKADIALNGTDLRAELKAKREMPTQQGRTTSSAHP